MSDQPALPLDAAVNVAPATAEAFARLTGRMSKTVGQTLEPSTVLEVLIAFWSAVVGSNSDITRMYLDALSRAKGNSHGA